MIDHFELESIWSRDFSNIRLEIETFNIFLDNTSLRSLNCFKFPEFPPKKTLQGWNQKVNLCRSLWRMLWKLKI